MTLEPLIQANIAIQIHVAAVALTMALTPVQLLLQRGSFAHRMMGRVWMSAMALTALSSFFISTLKWVGPFGPLHVLSIVALVSIGIAFRAARRGDHKTHAWTLFSLIGFALIGAGIFTLLPGRIMNAVFFG